MREKQMENSVAVDPSSKFPEEQTNFIRSLQDGGSFYPQGANILIGKIPKNKNKNQIRAPKEVYTKYCV